ncbi:MAG TPA: hypothetical protein P5519_09990 [Spirochaetia bacterium]|nr:hypothetical protein [Spirochaetia bacterium]
MKGRLAWRQPSVSGAPVLSGTNALTSGKRSFDSFHALCNVLNLRDIVADPDLDDSGFNTYLDGLYDDVVLRCLNGVFSTSEYFEQVMAYNRFSPTNNQEVTNQSKFVGYRIIVADNNTISVQIESVTMLFNADVTLTLHLFEEGNPEAIWTGDITAEANIPTINDISNLVFGYKTKVSRSSVYYLGYFQDDLGDVKAIQEQADFEEANMFCASPVMMNVIDSAPDFRNYSETNVPYGLNLELSSFRDNTDIIVRKAHLFDEVIGLQMAAQVIESIMHSNRSSGNERKMKDGVDKLMVYMDLKGTVPISDAPSTTGLATMLKNELTKLQKNFLPNKKAITVNLAEC